MMKIKYTAPFVTICEPKIESLLFTTSVEYGGEYKSFGTNTKSQTVSEFNDIINNDNDNSVTQ